jgi:hypothetical protein
MLKRPTTAIRPSFTGRSSHQPVGTACFSVAFALRGARRTHCIDLYERTGGVRRTDCTASSMSLDTTQLLATIATVYGIGGALSGLLQARQMRASGSARDVSLRFLSTYVGATGSGCSTG